jgi:hypothetical protein
MKTDRFPPLRPQADLDAEDAMMDRAAFTLAAFKCAIFAGAMIVAALLWR